MIIAFTGAGISKDSGISTFEENTELRNKLFRSFAINHPDEYREAIKEMKDAMEGKQPNDAHNALSEYDIPVITLNIDNLHQLAGTKELLSLHGTLPSEQELSYCDKLYQKPVLYEDPAENYPIAYSMVNMMTENDILLVVGVSFHTGIAVELRRIAKNRGAKVCEIQENAAENVRKFLVQNVKTKT